MGYLFDVCLIWDLSLMSDLGMFCAFDVNIFQPFVLIIILLFYNTLNIEVKSSIYIYIYL